MCVPRLDLENEESIPLLSSASDREDGNYYRKKSVNKCAWSCFYLFCFLSGQFINVDITKSGFKKIISVAGLILFGIQFILYLGHVVTAVTVKVCRIGNISDTINTSNGTINCALPHVHWKFSTAVTVGAFAAFFSYCFFTIIILMPVNGIFPCFSKCGRRRTCYSACVFCNACSNAHRKAFKNGTLSPFNDSNESSNMSATETICFFINYIIMLILYICSFGSSLWFAFAVYYKYNNHQPIYNLDSCWISKLNIAKIVLHFSVGFCTIHSCFIFSKIVYKVTNKLNKLAVDMDQVDFAGENAIQQESRL